MPPRPDSKNDLAYVQGNAVVGARAQGAPMGAAPVAPAPALVPTALRALRPRAAVAGAD